MRFGAMAADTFGKPDTDWSLKRFDMCLRPTKISSMPGDHFARNAWYGEIFLLLAHGPAMEFTKQLPQVND